MRGEQRKIYLPYCRRRSRAMANRKEAVKSRSSSIADTIIDEMKPYRIGRVVGMGLRVAGKIAGEQMAARVNAPASAPAPRQAAGPVIPGRSAGQVTGEAARVAGQA